MAIRQERGSVFSLNMIFLAGIGCLEEIVSNSNSFDTLKEFSCSDNDWLFGFFSYDLKNQIENLASENIDNLYFPLLNFF